MKLAQLLSEYDLPCGLADVEVETLFLDSRAVLEGGVFVALKGTNTDGRSFIDQAIARGAAVVFSEGEEFAVNLDASIPEIVIPELKKHVSLLASKIYGEPSKTLDVIGVTGTNGKSTCVSLLAQASELLGKPAWQLGTVGYGKPAEKLIDTGLTTPDAITCQRVLSDARREVQLVAMEVSSHAIVQHRVSGISFKGAVFTNITHDHLDYHETFEVYCEAKLSFLRDYDLQYVVLNLDDEFAQRIVSEGLITQSPLFTYSLNNSQADVYAMIEQQDLKGTRARIHSPWGSGLLESTLVGEFNLSNLLAIVTALAANGFALHKILEAVKYLHAVEGRMQKVVTQGQSPSVFIDYAHTPDALSKAIAALKNIASGQLWVVFGCGGDRDIAKRVLMAKIAEQHTQHVVVTSDNPRTEDPQKIIDDVVEGFANKNVIDVFIDRKQAIEYAVQQMPQDACLLIAGKGHEKYQIIGDQRLPFDDYLVAKNALSKRLAQGSALQ